MNSTALNIDLTQGKVAPALARKAGSELQKACTAKAPLQIGDVVETGGFNLPCKKVLHCSCPTYKDETTTKPVSGWSAGCWSALGDWVEITQPVPLVLNCLAQQSAPLD